MPLTYGSRSTRVANSERARYAGRKDSGERWTDPLTGSVYAIMVPEPGGGWAGTFGSDNGEVWRGTDMRLTGDYEDLAGDGGIATRVPAAVSENIGKATWGVPLDTPYHTALHKYNLDAQEDARRFSPENSTDAVERELEDSVLRPRGDYYPFDMRYPAPVPLQRAVLDSVFRNAADAGSAAMLLPRHLTQANDGRGEGGRAEGDSAESGHGARAPDLRTPSSGRSRGSLRGGSASSTVAGGEDTLGQRPDTLKQGRSVFVAQAAGPVMLEGAGVTVTRPSKSALPRGGVFLATEQPETRGESGDGTTGGRRATSQAFQRSPFLAQASGTSFVAGGDIAVSSQRGAKPEAQPRNVFLAKEAPSDWFVAADGDAAAASQYLTSPASLPRWVDLSRVFPDGRLEVSSDRGSSQRPRSAAFARTSFHAALYAPIQGADGGNNNGGRREEARSQPRTVFTAARYTAAEGTHGAGQEGRRPSSSAHPRSAFLAQHYVAVEGTSSEEGGGRAPSAAQQPRTVFVAQPHVPVPVTADQLPLTRQVEQVGRLSRFEPRLAPASDRREGGIIDGVRPSTGIVTGLQRYPAKLAPEPGRAREDGTDGGFRPVPGAQSRGREATAAVLSTETFGGPDGNAEVASKKLHMKPSSQVRPPPRGALSAAGAIRGNDEAGRGAVGRRQQLPTPATQHILFSSPAPTAIAERGVDSGMERPHVAPMHLGYDSDKDENGGYASD